MLARRRLDLLFVGLLADVDVVVSVAPHAVDQPGELACRREDRYRATLVASDSAERGAQGCL